jgi:hypothetical protein
MACILLSEGVAYTMSALGPVKTFTPCDLLTYHFKIIRYGTTWKGGAFRCRSRITGWLCSSALSHHGFFLSRESHYRF